MSSTADEIRQYAGDHWVKSARNQRERTFSIVTGDVHRGLGLRDLHPNVCSALASKKFLDTYGLELIHSEGPPSLKSSTVKYTYSFRDQGLVISKKPARGRKAAVEREKDASRETEVSTAEHYAAIRAGARVAAPDAIHLACAARAGMSLFLTNDHGLQSLNVPGIDVIAAMDAGLF